MSNSSNISRQTLESNYVALQELARRDFAEYCRQISRETIGHVEPAAHHLLLIEKLEALERGEINRLMVFMPPGHAKSTYASKLFPAWYIGRHPRNSIIVGSYSTDLSAKFAGKVRDQIASPYYPFYEVKLSESTRAKGEWETNLGGEFYAAGVGSSVTGRRADFGLIDDPIKGRKEAESQVIRDTTWDWYLADFRTRLKPGSPIALIQTRWHEDDLAGRILPEEYDFSSGWVKARDNEDWFVIIMPAIAEENDMLGRKPGQALWPDYYTIEKLEQERITQGLRNWISLYQQRPAPETGSFYKKEWFNFYDKKPEHLAVFAASDYAVTEDGGDFTEHGIIGVSPDHRIYIIDWWSGQTSSDVWIEQQCDLILKWKPRDWGTERGQIEKSVGPYLKRRMLERNAFTVIQKYTSSVDKASRAQTFRALCAMGRVYFPNDKPWADRLIKQLLAFPAGTYDDAVDVCSLFGAMLMKLWGNKIPEIPDQKTEKPSLIRMDDIIARENRKQTDVRNIWS